MTASVTQWAIPGAKGALIHGATHLPTGDAVAAVVLVHGFKGYKDYGMLGHIAATLANARCIVHRVSLSHSGMGHGHGAFNEALFEKDTWNRGVEDLLALLAAMKNGTLEGGGVPWFLVGHSRGGALSLATAGRHAHDESLGSLRGVVSLSAPARLNGLDPAATEMLMAGGRLPSPSARTAQTLHVGPDWLQEQLDDPKGHDMASLMGRVGVPVLLIHGAEDPTVAPEDAQLLAGYAPDRVRVEFIQGANHVFNTPNPFDMHASPSVQLAHAEAAIVAFVTAR